MKKVIAIALCLMLLLAGCTMDGREVPGIDILLSDLVCTFNQQELVDLEGVSVNIAAGSSDEAAGLRLTVSAGDGQENTIILSLLEDALLFTLDSAADGEKTYAVDSNTIFSALDGLSGGLSGVLGQALPDGGESADGGMTDEQLQKAMDELEKQLNSMGMGGFSLGGNDDEKKEEIDQAKLLQLLTGCISLGDITQYNGEDFITVNIDIDHDTFVQLLSLVYTDLPFDLDFAQILEQAGLTVQMSGTVAVNNDASKMAVGVSLDLVSDDGDTANIDLSVQDVSDDETVDVYLELTVNDEQVAIGLSIHVLPLDEIDWLPGGVGPDAIYLTEGDTDTLEAFTDDLSNVLLQMVGTILGIDVGNQAINGLEDVAP